MLTQPLHFGIPPREPSIVRSTIESYSRCGQFSEPLWKALPRHCRSAIRILRDRGFVGRTERQRLPVIRCPLNSPEKAGIRSARSGLHPSEFRSQSTKPHFETSTLEAAKPETGKSR